MKKTVCLLLAFIMIFTLFACGKKQDEQTGSTDTVSYAAQRETSESRIIATVSTGASPKYAVSADDEQYIGTLLSGAMHETVFSGNADYEISIGGGTYYYDKKTGELGNSSVIILSGEEKEVFENTVEKYFENDLPDGATLKSVPQSTTQAAGGGKTSGGNTEKVPGTTVAYTGRNNTEKRKNTSDPSIQYIRANESNFSDESYPKVVFIKSAEELGAYKSGKSSDYYFDSGFGSSKSFNEATAKYDSGFFKDKALVMVVTREGSGSVRYDGVHVNGSEATIALDRRIPEVRTEDMASWHIIIELDRNDPVFNYSPDEVQVLVSE